MGRQRDKNWSFVQCSAEVINWGLIQEKSNSFGVYGDKITADGMEQEELQPGRTRNELRVWEQPACPKAFPSISKAGNFQFNSQEWHFCPHFSSMCGCSHLVLLGCDFLKHVNCNYSQTTSTSHVFLSIYTVFPALKYDPVSAVLSLGRPVPTLMEKLVPSTPGFPAQHPWLLDYQSITAECLLCSLSLLPLLPLFHAALLTL